MIVVVEGPSATGKTTWCKQHAPQWLPEPVRGSSDDILRYQIDRWRRALDSDGRDELVVLDGDPFKLYYSWAAWRVGKLTDTEWGSVVDAARRHFVSGEHGLADLILYSDPGEDELRRRKEGDDTRSRRNFELHTNMRPYFRQWYEAMGRLDPTRVVWEHPADGLTADLLSVGRRPSRSDPQRLECLLSGLPAER